MSILKQEHAKLFEPLKIRNLEIKNRISMAPMGLVGYADGDGGFNKNAQNYYIERAKGGTGLIITGMCSVDYNEVLDRGVPCPTYNPLMFGMSTKAMNEKIHAYDSKIFLQLTGGLGRSGIPGLFKKAIAPSENSNRFDPRITHEPMTIEEIQTWIQNFIKSAVIAKESGFDGVEIHAVHEGYLLDQFALSIFNRRDDEYGGSLEARLKVATDIVKGIKQACGPDFPVSLRYSVKSFMKGLRQGALPGEEFDEAGRDYEEGLEAAKILEAAGYDVLNVDAGTYDSWYWNHPPMYFEEGMYREFGRKVKEVVSVPVILAGRMDNPEVAIDALNGCCDMVSYGRPLLADSELPNKIRTEQFEDIRPCLSCHDGCMGRIAQGLPLSCTVNPACGREVEYGLEPTTDPKNILIIGGGVAGMEAARVAALRGHKATIIEASDKLGGNVIPGGVPDFKHYDRQLISWYEYQLKKLNIEVIFNTRADKALVEAHNPDIVISATGSTPVMPNFGDKNNIVSASDVLLEKVTVGENIAVIGGGLVGAETALWLRQQGKTVTIVEMQPDILGGPHGMPFMNYQMLKDLLPFNQVNILLNTKLEEVKDNSVVVTTSEETKEITADTVVVAVGYRENRSFIDSINDLNKPIYNIGDSRHVKSIQQAIWEAYEVARGI